MTMIMEPMISLEQARQLVKLLEAEQFESANHLVQQLTVPGTSELFAEVGKLTRQLHDSLQSFHLDPSLNDLIEENIPDAKKRIAHVIGMTEQAANRTMDAVESCLPIADNISQQLTQIQPQWQRLMQRQLQLGEFKSLCHNLDDFLLQANTDTKALNGLLTDVLMAQDYQDLTGQILSRVIELVREVEESLISLLTAFTQANGASTATLTKNKKAHLADAEGPILDAKEREDVVSGQDDVDDLLSSLGF
jgi:chemotaxis protein CheZ